MALQRSCLLYAHLTEHDLAAARLNSCPSQWPRSWPGPQELERKAERCVVQLSNAEKLIGGLGGEEKRWTDTVAKLTLAMDKLPGESL